MIVTPPRKIVLAVAPVGREVHPPSVNPVAPEDVAAEVVACAKAGAAMVHLHVRDAQGRQTERLEDFSRTLDLIRAGSDIVLQGSTGGLSSLTLEERCIALNDPRVEVASLNMGSVNFGDDVYVNRLPDIRYWAGRMRETRTVPELEIFEAGMLPVVRQMEAEGVLRPPFYFNLGLGFRWALPADPRSLFFMQALMPPGIPWGMVHDGMADLTLLATAIGLGAAVVRVGFEDSVRWAPDRTVRTNLELVERLAAMVRAVGCAVATPAEARAILGIG